MYVRTCLACMVPIHNCMYVKVFLVRSNCACRQLFMEQQTKMCGGVCVRVTRVLDKIYGCAYPSLPQTTPTYILLYTYNYIIHFRIYMYIIVECVHTLYYTVGIWRVHNCLWWHLLRKWLALVLIYMIIFTSTDSSVVRGTYTPVQSWIKSFMVFVNATLEIRDGCVCVSVSVLCSWCADGKRNIFWFTSLYNVLSVASFSFEYIFSAQRKAYNQMPNGLEYLTHTHTQPYMYARIHTYATKRKYYFLTWNWIEHTYGI